MQRLSLTMSFVLAIALFAVGCGNSQQGANQTASGTNSQTAKDPNKKVKIGFAMDTLKEERWQRDKEAFEARCKEKNIDCVITVADNKADRQSNDVQNLLTQ